MSAGINYKDFTTFTGVDLLKIDIANTYGADKETWERRLEIADELLVEIEDWNSRGKVEVAINAYKESAEEPLLFERGVLAYLKAKQGNPISHNSFMDATASGIQILARLSDCYTTAVNSNVVNTNKRMDPYTLVAEKMSEYLPDSEMFYNEDGTHMDIGQIRSLVKKPINCQ